MLIALLPLFFVRAGVVGNDGEEVGDYGGKAGGSGLISRGDLNFDNEDPEVLRELRERMFSSNEEIKNANENLAAALRIAQALKENSSLFDENASNPLVMRKFMNNKLDPVLGIAKANILSQMRLVRKLELNPSLLNESIDINSEKPSYFTSGLDPALFNASSNLPIGMRRSNSELDLSSSALDFRKANVLYYKYKKLTPEYDVQATKNRTFMMMRQIIYRSMERLSSVQGTMERYANDPRMRLSYVLKRLEMWARQMHAMYTNVTYPRSNKKHWDWNGYIKDAYYYAHYFRKYIDIIYGVDLVITLHNRAMAVINRKIVASGENDEE